MADFASTTRRALLRALPALTVTAAAPAVALATPPVEDPFSRVRRLMDELEEALANPAGWASQFGVRITPRSEGGNGSWMFDIRAQNERDRELAAARSYLDDLDAMPPRQRVKHFLAETQFSLSEMRPGRWSADIICNDKGDVVGACVVRGGDK